MAIPARLNTSAEVLADTNEFGFNDGSDKKIGDLSESGLTLGVETEENEVRSGTQREVYVYLRGAVSQMWTGELLNINVNNFAFAMGLDEDAANITGTGTSADPYILTIDPEKFGEQAARLYYATGVRSDGMTIRAEATTGRIFSPNVEWTMAQGEPTAIPFQLRVTGTWLIKQNT